MVVDIKNYKPEKKYIISENELKSWVRAGLKYIALWNGGVSNWSYCYDALDDFKNNPEGEMPQDYERITDITINDLIKEGSIKEWQ